MRCSLISICIALMYLTTNAQRGTVADRINLVEHNLAGPVRTEKFKGWTLAERMAHYKVNGVSIAVIHNHKLEWAKGYGLADLASKIPVTSQTRFQAGSISKSINAVGILKLAQDGRLNLDKDVNQYLKSWQFPYDSVSNGHHINLAQLLSHTAGLNVSGFSGYQINEALPATLQIIKGASPANSPRVHSIAAPGVRYEYSGGGTTITQLVLQDVAHKTYDQYMQEHVLEPLGMLNSTFANPVTSNPSHTYATGYYENGDQVKGNYHLYPEKAAAGLWTTPSDLAKYIIAVQKSYSGKIGLLLNPRLAKLMLTPYIDQRVGLGVFIDNFYGVKYFEHDGLTHGFNCQYYGSLTRGNGVVVMTNSTNMALIPEIVNSVANVYGFKGLYRSKIDKTILVDEATLKSFTGDYTLAPGAILTVFTEGRQLYVRLTGQDKIALFPETKSKFFMKVIDAQIEFVKDASGKVIKAILYQNGSANEAPKIM